MPYFMPGLHGLLSLQSAFLCDRYKHENTLYRIECLLDETQQYLHVRRDCLEITGATIKPDDNPKQTRVNVIIFFKLCKFNMQM